jgi:uncharacterized protein YciI
MIQFLYTIRPTRPGLLEASTAEEDRIVDDHFRYLQGLVEAGVVLLAGRTLNTDPSSFGIVILLAPSEAEAHQIMNADPAVQAGVFRAALFPYRIALTSERLGRDVFES